MSIGTILLTVGISVLLGAGSVGAGPVPTETGSWAMSPQPASATDTAAKNNVPAQRLIAARSAAAQ